MSVPDPKGTWDGFQWTSGASGSRCGSQLGVLNRGRKMTAVPRRLKRIEVHCPEYETTATIRINDAHSSGTDHLEVDYRSPDHGHFTIAIPDDWTDQDLLELIFLPPRDPGKKNWPAWEIPAYDFVSSRLFRFWKGEKKPDK